MDLAPSHRPSHLSHLSQPLFLVILFLCIALGVLLFFYQLFQLPVPPSLYTKLFVCVSVLYFLTLSQTSHFVSTGTMDASMTMDMTATATATAASASSTAMAMDMGGSCEISMLWNWNTVNACFISSTWQITSRGMFAGSCIGVVLLVIVLEMLRRAVKEYDRYLVRQHLETQSDNGNKSACAAPGFRPTVLQQAVRALLHMAQFAVAYFVMLLAMYYNGYFIICIFIGAYIGSFVFHWETMGLQTGATSAATEATVCCG
ncbi:ctr copper transporter [Ophiostoma piceae UAMH 11346]|uniref:Copper transport protein n=1 Tax=Ophiostoma piceae (strain UAMH 11346) TaxID=1262450 RepID=S3C6G0_OPHP1|nr:ctr copper transporter [Ophiostoma piceae UAMH 11346]